MNPARIEKFMADIRLIDEDRFALVQSLRHMVLGLDATMAEEFKYGGLLFALHEPFCGVFSYKKHVSLELGCGTSLSDSMHVLEGTGSSRRHIKLHSLQEIASKHVAQYLRQALRIAQQKP